MTGGRHREQTEARLDSWVYLLLIAAVLSFAIAAYGLVRQLDVPESTGLSLVLIAIAAGFASFFSPCSFPLLTTLLAADVRSDDSRSTRRALGLGAAMSSGAALFLALLGAGIALGGGTLFSGVTFTSDAGRLLRLVVALVLVLLGLLQLRLLPGSMAAPARLARPAYEWLFGRRQAGHPTQGYVAYGFGYLLAGFG